jgi:hypothetical protein
MTGLEFFLTLAVTLLLLGFIELLKTRQNTKRVKVIVEAQRDPRDVFGSKTKR